MRDPIRDTVWREWQEREQRFIRQAVSDCERREAERHEREAQRREAQRREHDSEEEEEEGGSHQEDQPAPPVLEMYYTCSP